MLAGCAGSPTPEPTPSDTATASAQVCADAVAGIVTAASDLVANYSGPAGTGTRTGAAEPTTGPTSEPTSTGDALSEAVAGARAMRQQAGCGDGQFRAALESGLKEIEPSGPIAEAVLLRVSASLLGEVRQETGEWVLEPGADLAEALSRAADGSTLVLPAGTTELDGTLVLLAGVTLRGAGRDQTVLRSAAADAAFIVATGSLVKLQDLTVDLTGAKPASGLIAGPSASVAITGARIAGATAAGDGIGGAGVHLSAEGAEASGRGTTLEITGSSFERNAWAGVAVSGGHRVSIESSTFADNGEAGIVFLDSSSGSIASSTFTGNSVAVAATGSATPTLLSSAVSGGSVGVQADAMSAPIVDGVTIDGASTAAMIFGGESTGSISATKCENVPNGIVVSDSAAPTLGTNTCAIARGAM